MELQLSFSGTPLEEVKKSMTTFAAKVMRELWRRPKVDSRKAA